MHKFLKINDKHFKKVIYDFDDELTRKFFDKNEEYLLSDFGIERANSTSELILSIKRDLDKWKEYFSTVPSNRCIIISQDEECVYLVEVTEDFELEEYTAQYDMDISNFSFEKQNYIDVIGNNLEYWTV